MTILYEDNHVIVAVKPQNVPSQADSSGDMDFLSMVKNYVKVKYHKPGEAYIGLLHRLDRPAGGAMVFARTSKAAARLSAQIRDGRFQKSYCALVTGELEQSGELCDYLRKDGKTNNSRVVAADTPGAKLAQLSYEVVDTQQGISLVRVKLVTGRSHQIRVQMAHMGAPLVGDKRYGGAESEALCLWSHMVGFFHPTLKEWMELYSEPPRKMPWNLFAAGD